MRAKPRVVMSANATPGVGGQGLNYRHMLEAIEPLSSAMATFDQRNVPPSRIAKLSLEIPVLRRRADLTTLASDLSFDRNVARRLEAADVFQGVVGQCATTLRAAKERGMRGVLDVVNHHIDDYVEHVTRECAKFDSRGFIHPRMRSRILREYEESDVIRVMSHVSARTFETRGVPRSKIVVASPPMNVDEFPIARFDDPIFRVVFVGLIAPWKGFRLLVEAFDRLRLPKSELVLWGGIGLRKTTQFFRQHQAKNPTIHVRSEAIRDVGFDEVYGKASVLVHPSLSDGFAYVVTEAMASGLPVIVTDNTGASDLVKDGDNGFVVPTGDVRAIEERLEFLYRHRDRLPAMGRSARAAAATLTMDSFRASMKTAITGEA